MRFGSVVRNIDIAAEPSSSEIIQMKGSSYGFLIRYDSVDIMRNEPPEPSSSETIDITGSRYVF